METYILLGITILIAGMFFTYGALCAQVKLLKELSGLVCDMSDNMSNHILRKR